MRAHVCRPTCWTWVAWTRVPRDELHGKIKKIEGERQMPLAEVSPHKLDSETPCANRGFRGRAPRRKGRCSSNPGYPQTVDEDPLLAQVLQQPHYLIDIARALPSCGAELVCVKRFFFMNLSRRYSSGAGVSTTGLHHFGGLSEVST